MYRRSYKNGVTKDYTEIQLWDEESDKYENVST